MKYIIYYSNGVHFSHFTKNLRGAKKVASQRIPEGFKDEGEHYISIYEFDGMLPIATRQNGKWDNN